MKSFIFITTVLTVLELTLAIDEKTFYLIANAPEIRKYQPDLYLYAISKNGMTDGEEIEFEEKKNLKCIAAKTGHIEADDVLWGYYKKLVVPSRHYRALVGNYAAKYTTDAGLSIYRNVFTKPKTNILNFRGVHSVTVYPETSGSERLAGKNYIGVSWSPGCRAIKWCKGRRRNINTGPKLALTSIKDGGLYTIFRPSRGKRGWFVQIKVIVASCQEDEYLDDGTCVSRTVTSCDNGGVPKDAADECIYPPYFTTDCAPGFCPTGWTSFGDVDYRCYRSFPTRMNFAEYESFCQSQDGHLASFHTVEEMNGIVAQLESGRGYWFGLNDRDVEGQFCYTDDSRFDLSNWSPSEPNNAGRNEDCAEIVSPSGKWNDLPCTRDLGGICMQVPCSSFVLGHEAGATLRCEDLEGGNLHCGGLLICLGDLYGCKCASGWHGNSCDKACDQGRWGPGCELFCPDTEKNCNRFTGPI